MNTRPSLWTVVLNYNGLEDTRKCLASLREAADPWLTTLVVDNASDPDPLPFLRGEFPWAVYLRNPVNGGYAGGNNFGIRHALRHGADQVVLLNNDTTVAPQFARRLAAASAAHSQFGVLGPVINFMSEPDQVMTDGVVFNRRLYPGFFQRLPVPLVDETPPAATEVDIVNGCCMMVSAQVLACIGLIDERFFLIHEESDFCLRARRAGFRCGILGESLVWHKGSSTVRRGGHRLQRYYDARNLWLLLKKHSASQRGCRGGWRSRLEFAKYLYYRYCLEQEEGSPESAKAVLQGLWDALSGRYGPFRPAPRPGLSVLCWLLEAYRTWRGRRQHPGEAIAHATAVY